MLEGYISPTRRRKTAEVVARRIVAGIADRKLTPGTLLSQEPEMQAHLGVGRSTLREALRLLETQGVLSLRAGRGPVVQQPTPEYLLNSLTLLLQFQGATFDTLLQARLLFEPAVAGEAARKATPGVLAELRANLHAARAGSLGVQELMQHELEFHHVVAKASGNVFAETMMVALIGALTSAVLDGVPRHDNTDDLRFHELLIGALERHDAEGASTLMREHLEDVHRMTEATYPELLRRQVRWM